MTLLATTKRLNEISRFTARQTGGFRNLSPDAKRIVLDRLGDEITADKVRDAVAVVNGKRKKENGK